MVIYIAAHMVIVHDNFYIILVIIYFLFWKLFRWWHMRSIKENFDSTAERSWRKVLHLDGIYQKSHNFIIHLRFSWYLFYLFKICLAWVWLDGAIFFNIFILVFQNYLLGAFKPPCNISITFSDGKTRKQVYHLP